MPLCSKLYSFAANYATLQQNMPLCSKTCHFAANHVTLKQIMPLCSKTCHFAANYAALQQQILQQAAGFAGAHGAHRSMPPRVGLPRETERDSWCIVMLKTSLP